MRNDQAEVNPGGWYGDVCKDAKTWCCERCGKVPDGLNPEFRFYGQPDCMWQHKCPDIHPQAGHCDCIKIADNPQALREQQITFIKNTQNHNGMVTRCCPICGIPYRAELKATGVVEFLTTCEHLTEGDTTPFCQPVPPKPNKDDPTLETKPLKPKTAEEILGWLTDILNQSCKGMPVNKGTSDLLKQLSNGFFTKLEQKGRNYFNDLAWAIITGEHPYRVNYTKQENRLIEIEATLPDNKD